MIHSRFPAPTGLLTRFALVVSSVVLSGVISPEGALLTTGSFGHPFFAKPLLAQQPAPEANPGAESSAASRAASREPLRLLFLGDGGHHQPADRFRRLEPVLRPRGIELTYTDEVADLNERTLSRYDGLVIYANIERISPEQEQALLNFVKGGKGFIPLHCASYCFLNSDKYVALVGAQFQRHGTGVFRTEIARPDHPVMRGFRGFESWDETYEHHRHNERDRVVLAYRVGPGGREPWTWVRTQGEGRVFYTAWGHDHRTWDHPGFHNLVERGIRWACGGDPAAVPAYADRPAMTPPRKDVEPFQYVDAKIAFYPPGGARRGDGAWNKMQLPLEPEESLKHLTTPVDFEVRLFASEPDIRKPICMNWDERGRLWIAETVDYPNDLQPEGAGNDRITICEDTDNDGRADKFTVFADRLSIPTSLAFHRGGVIVHQAPHTLYLKDTDGDDRADVRKILFSGWSVGDTHAGPSNLNWGPDNWLYGMVGYAGFRGRIGDREQRFQTGFYRFRPDSGDFEFLRNTNNNSWGVGFSEEGILFGSTANGNPSVYLPIPNRYYERVRGWSSSVLGGIARSAEFHPITDKVRQVDHHGSFTAAAGHALYTARQYPPEYWNRAAFVAGPTGHLLATFTLQRQGSDFTSRNAWNLLASDDEWTAPIMAEVGPDGQVWVIDWYNYIVQHNPTPEGFERGKGNAYITDLRDKRHGRIYRVVAREAKEEPPLSLAGATAPRLVATLGHSNRFWRRHAQRLLVERGQQDVVPQLIELTRDQSVDAVGLNVGAIHALWTLHGLGALDGRHPEARAAAVACLEHPSAGVRMNAVKVLPLAAESLRAIIDKQLLDDPDAQVRLAALLAVSDQPSGQDPAVARAAAAAIVDALSDRRNAEDRWIPDAATSAAAAHSGAFLREVAGRPPIGEPLLRVTAIVAEHVARGQPDPTLGELLVSLAAAPPATAAAVIDGLARGWPAGAELALQDEQEAALERIFERLPAGGQGQLVKLASTWGSRRLESYAERIAQSLLKLVADEGREEGRRVAAARQLVEFQADSSESMERLLDVVSPRTPPELAAGILTAVARSSAQELPRALVKRLAEFTPATRAVALRALLERPAGAAAALDGLEEGQLSLSDLALDQKQALLSHPDRKLAERARRVFSESGMLANPDRQKVLEQWGHVARQDGDAQGGKLMFLKHCAACHMHGGEGKRIGPDLTGMAVHPKTELLTHILDPSRSVEGNFRVYTVVTAEGRILNGLLASETRTTVELFDAEGKRHVVLRDDIDELIASRKSLMPEGFEKQMSERELTDLLEFLTQRGTFLPLPLEKAATVVSTRGMFFSEQADAERLIFPDWKPVSVEGVPFQLVDPRGDRVPNAILLHGPQGNIPPRMPKSVSLPCNSSAKAIHLLSGVSGWGYPLGQKGSVSMIVRLHYADGSTEDHPLRNGVHFADYIRRVDVPESKLAFMLRNQQIRYLAVYPESSERIERIELVKGPDQTAPVVMAVTVETR